VLQSPALLGLGRFDSKIQYPGLLACLGWAKL